jgi:hypothetical protein
MTLAVNIHFSGGRPEHAMVGGAPALMPAGLPGADLAEEDEGLKLLPPDPPPPISGRSPGMARLARTFGAGKADR